MKGILFIFILLMGISQANDKDGISFKRIKYNQNAKISQANDKDGIFLGFELGLGEVKNTESVAGYTFNSTLSLPLYGFRLGYVKYFGDLFGIYTYANFKDLFTSTKGDYGKNSIHTMSFAANIDFLLNFYNDKSLFMGGFAGIGIGGANTKARSDDVSNSMSGLYTDLKLGLKTSYEHNSISLIASFPVIPIKEGNTKSRTNYTISLAYDYKF